MNDLKTIIKNEWQSDMMKDLSKLSLMTQELANYDLLSIRRGKRAVDLFRKRYPTIKLDYLDKTLNQYERYCTGKSIRTYMS